MQYTTRLQLDTAQSIARRFAQDSVEGRREDAMRFLIAVEHALSLGITAGADRDFLIDTAKGCHDAISNLQAGMYRELDAAGADQADAYIYYGDLDALIAQLEAADALAKKRGL